ncbi:DUF1801 domain-containing protein [Mycetocola reblochoni]|uniref:DUF1801 domain-containing protein n=1 Tax=Mycetocola reblochoni TaxID=331618 RepID=UPI003F9A7261
MDARGSIDRLIADHPDWRGAVLAEARAVILAADDRITEDWKWRGAPTWELDGILVVGGLFSRKVKLGFLYGASLPDPEGVFNGELGGSQRRSYELFEGDALNAAALRGLVRAAVARNEAARSARSSRP